MSALANIDLSYWRSQRALVTGGGGSIGGAIVDHLLHLGSHVTVVDLKPRPTGLRSRRLTWWQADVCHAERAWLETRRNCSRGFSIAVHAAAVRPDHHDARLTIRTNYWAVRKLSEELLPSMALGGRIVWIGSTAGYRFAWSDKSSRELRHLLGAGPDGPPAHARLPASLGAAYSLAKFALRSRFRRFAHQALAKSVTAHFVALGPTVSAALNELAASQPARVARLVDEMPLGRAIELREITKLLDYALGPDARALGPTVFRLDGGFHAKLPVRND